MVEILALCGCRFEYEPDHAEPYHARWITCGKGSCSRSQGRVDMARLDCEIKIAEDRLAALRAEHARRFPA